MDEQATPVTPTLCFVDYKETTRRRPCQWEKDFQNNDVELCSIPDLKNTKGQKDLPRFRGRKLIVCNWDVANGEYNYDSDVTLAYFRARGAQDIRLFIDSGTRFLCEIQANGGRPNQNTYDSIFGEDEVTVAGMGTLGSSGGLSYGNSVIVHPAGQNHPILASLMDLKGNDDPRPVQEWVPALPQTPASESAYCTYRDAIYWGWFTKWGKGWVPLLQATQPSSDGKPRVVMLAKEGTYPGGEYIATTMLMANTGLSAFRKGLRNVDREALIGFYSKVYQAHERSMRLRTFGAWLAYLAVLGIVGYLLIWIPDGKFAHIAGVIFGPVSALIGFKTISEWLKQIRAKPIGL